MLPTTTGAVLTLNEAVVCPASTVTLGGTVAAAELFDASEMTVSAAAGALRVTMPLATAPPVTVDGTTLRVMKVNVPIVRTPRRLWKKFQLVSTPPDRDQRALIRLINSLARSEE